MDQKDLKKLNLILSSSITTTLETLINLISNPLYRQILNPLGVLCAILIAFSITHQIKTYSIDLIIKNNEEEITKSSDPKEIERLKRENTKIKRSKHKLEFF